MEGSSPRMKFIISSAPSCLNSALKLPRTFAAASLNLALRSSLKPVPTGVMTILLPSRLKLTSLPGATPAASRMCSGNVKLECYRVRGFGLGIHQHEIDGPWPYKGPFLWEPLCSQRAGLLRPPFLAPAGAAAGTAAPGVAPGVAVGAVATRARSRGVPCGLRDSTATRL